MRKIAVIGMSSFGYFLCRAMAERKSSVMAIDSNEAKIDQVKPFVEKAIIADATDKEVLVNLGLSEVDAVVVSLGDRIDASILVTYYLRELGVKEIYAKAISEDHGKILNVIGATEVIFPEKDMAERLVNRLERSSILEYFEIAEGYSIIEWAPPNSFVNKTLAELDLTNKYNVQVIMVKEVVPERVTVVPKATQLIKDSDGLVLLGRDEDLERLQQIKE
jgi:trk system potassium uptake protein TrkA